MSVIVKGKADGRQLVHILLGLCQLTTQLIAEIVMAYGGTGKKEPGEYIKDKKSALLSLLFQEQLGKMNKYKMVSIIFIFQLFFLS